MAKRKNNLRVCRLINKKKCGSYISHGYVLHCIQASQESQSKACNPGCFFVLITSISCGREDAQGLSSWFVSFMLPGENKTKRS